MSKGFSTLHCHCSSAQRCQMLHPTRRAHSTCLVNLTSLAILGGCTHSNGARLIGLDWQSDILTPGPSCLLQPIIFVKYNLVKGKRCTVDRILTCHFSRLRFCFSCCWLSSILSLASLGPLHHHHLSPLIFSLSPSYLLVQILYLPSPTVSLTLLFRAYLSPPPPPLPHTHPHPPSRLVTI